FACAAEDSSAPPSNPIPALLTRRSIRPARASISSTALCTDSSSVTSHTSMATPSGVSGMGLRLVPNTLYPARRNACAVTNPIPEEAPVTRATPLSILLICLCFHFGMEHQRTTCYYQFSSKSLSKRYRHEESFEPAMPHRPQPCIGRRCVEHADHAGRPYG